MLNTNGLDICDEDAFRPFVAAGTGGVKLNENLRSPLAACGVAGFDAAGVGLTGVKVLAKAGDALCGNDAFLSLDTGTAVLRWAVCSAGTEALVFG